ncbi:hypothetical protein TCON_2750, partial [Astathelohania contejeani]
ISGAEWTDARLILTGAERTDDALIITGAERTDARLFITGAERTDAGLIVTGAERTDTRLIIPSSVLIGDYDLYHLLIICFIVRSLPFDWSAYFWASFFANKTLIFVFSNVSVHCSLVIFYLFVILYPTQ